MPPVATDPDEIIDDFPSDRGLNAKLVKSMIKTGVLGFVMVLFLSSVLYETSTNTPFAALNGLALLLMAAAMFAETNNATAEQAPLMLMVVRGGVLLTVVAAVGTYMVRFASLGPYIDVAFLVSTSCGNCYALSYVLVSIWNKYVRNSTFVARQIYMMAAATLLVGGVSGFVFAVVDVEDHVRRLGWEQWVCAATGFIAGALIGHANYFAVDESLSITFEGLEMDDDV